MRSYDSAPRPPPPPPARQQVVPLSQSPCVSSWSSLREAKSCWTARKPVPHIDHSILSRWYRTGYCTVLFFTCLLSKKGFGSGFGPFLRSSVGIQSMVDQIRNLSYIGGSRLSVLRIRLWKPVPFDPGVQIQNEKKIRIRDKRSGSYFRESLVTDF
jgi:hypothetical protein